MRIIFLLSFILITRICYSQQRDVYIFYEPNPNISIIKSQDSSSHLEIYQLNLSSANPITELSVDKDGKLSKKVTVNGGPVNVLRLRYDNLKGDNPPQQILRSKMINTLTVNEVLTADYNNLIKVLKTFENVYIVDVSKFVKGAYLVKRVSIEPALDKL